MSNEVDYVPFATGGGANVYTPATYQALAVVGTGVEPGLADPQLANTTWRLASMISAAVATFISNVLNINVLDDGNLANLITNFTSAVSLGAATTPGRIVTSSATLNLVNSDYALGLNRTSGVAAQVANSPATPSLNQEFRFDDLAGNFNTFPVTFTPPVGHTINGRSTFVMNVNRGAWVFHYYGSSIWGVK